MTTNQLLNLIDEYANAKLTHYMSAATEARATVVEALDALTKDAARYRWLVSARTKEQVSNPNVGLQPQLPQDRVLSELSSWFIHKEWTDLRIDAAMKESK